MTRGYYRRGLAAASTAGLLAALAAVVSAAPAGATLICPPGTSNPSYCVNVPPVASTGHASPVGGTTATLNGVSGPGVPGGDVTNYFFDYGTTTAYGSKTPTGTVGNCPPGTAGSPNYCPGVPPTENVSSDVAGLQPCTTYHYRITSVNPDGKTVGTDSQFVTGFAKPITKVKVTPKRVKRGHTIKVTISLLYRADIKIFLRTHHLDVKHVDFGQQGPGTVTLRMRVPRHIKHRKRGFLVVRVVGRLSCGKQIWDTTIRFH